MSDDKSVSSPLLEDWVENIFAPEMFASDAAFFSMVAGNVTLTLTSLRWDNSTRPGRQQRVVVGRVVLPLKGAQTLASGLYDFLAKNGLDPAQRPSDPKQMQ